jgi:hypothetical protein
MTSTDCINYSIVEVISYFIDVFFHYDTAYPPFHFHEDSVNFPFQPSASPSLIIEIPTSQILPAGIIRFLRLLSK